MNNSLYTDPHQRKLLKKWGMILESGTPIKDENTKVVLAQILENTRNYYIQHGMLTEAGTPAGARSQADIMGTKKNGYLRGNDNYPYYNKEDGVDGGYGDYYLPNVVMPMLRRIIPDLMANELVAVQPLNGPVGFAMAFRPLVGENYTREVGYNTVDTTYTGLTGDGTSEFESLSGTVKGTEAWSAYGGDSWLGKGKPTGEAEWMTLDEYPKVSFGLTKTTVEAKTRKLAAHWSPELAEDMQAMHGIDVEKEMVNTLTYEVGAEIDRQIITEMVKAAIIGGSTTTWSPVSADGLDQMGRLATLLTKIAIEAQQIAIRTKRGNANFAVTTPRITALLQQLSMNKFTSFKNNAAMPSVPDTGVGALAKVGLINDDSMLLIRDAAVQSNDKDYFLMGYKGKQIGDSGIIYCPYIPLQLQKIMQPNTFSYSVAARTRYGVMNNPWEAKNYYAFMTIKDVTSETGYSFNESNRVFVGSTSPIKSMNGLPIVMPQA